MKALLAIGLGGYVGLGVLAAVLVVAGVGAQQAAGFFQKCIWNRQHSGWPKPSGG